MWSKWCNPRAWAPGPPALVLGLLGLGAAASPLYAADLRGSASARIEQLAGVTFAGSPDGGGSLPGLAAAALDPPGEPPTIELTVTAAPHTAVSLTVISGPLGSRDRESDRFFDSGDRSATDAEGRLTLRLGSVYRHPAQVIVNY